MATTITIPDFDFSSFYYAQILERLIRYKRINVPELTEESPFEPFNQMMRMMALVGHSNNVLIDLVANENTLPTAKLPESVRNMLRLIGEELAPPAPSQVDVVYELSKVFTAAFEVVSENAQAATAREGDLPIIFFEALTALTVSPTDAFSSVLAEESSTFTDYTAEANSPTTPADDWAPWTAPASKDALYFGHAEAMWVKMAVSLTTPGSGITGVWEFYDGDFRKVAPTSATDIGGGQLEFDLTSYLGTSDRQGTKIRVQLNESTAFEDVFSVWSGGVNKATTGLLGQSSPSTTATDYTVGSDWEIIDELTDGTSDWTAAGDVDYPLPQTLTRDWIASEVEGVFAYWFRYRIISVSTPTSPTIQRVRMDTGKQYVLRSATQGQVQTDDPLGSSDGTAGQRFETSRNYFVAGSETFAVDGETWVRVDNFLASQPTDKHYIVELGENDRATFVTGDGVEGRIPPAGVGNVAAAYRWGANENGNVGALKITEDKTGLTFVNKLWNPRPAAGWDEGEAADEESLERAKILHPANMRVGEVALNADDAEILTRNFTDEAGARPFSRARGFEEGFGPKTLEMVVVAAGGGQASNAQLTTLEEYFNGDQFSIPKKAKHFVQNQQVHAVNFTTKAIDVTATVTGDVTAQEIENRLLQIIQPEALKDDGVTYEWEFGAEVPASRVNHEIFETDESITKVDLTVPAAPIPLAARELPVLGTVNITVI